MEPENKIKVSELREFDISRYLKSKPVIVEYLHQVFEEGDDAEMTSALEHVAKVKKVGD